MPVYFAVVYGLDYWIRLRQGKGGPKPLDLNGVSDATDSFGNSALDSALRFADRDPAQQSALRCIGRSVCCIGHGAHQLDREDFVRAGKPREIIRRARDTARLQVFCDAQQEFTKGRLYFYYYLNYLFKYVELFDTVLLGLRGKPIPFLHRCPRELLARSSLLVVRCSYHHAATLVLTFTQLRAQSCVQVQRD